MPIIAIASATHCAGAEIAEQLADRLRAPLVSQEHLERLARTFDLPAQRRRRFLLGPQALGEPATRDAERAAAQTRAALSELLQRSNLVYHGTALHLLPTSVTHVLRVAVIGERPFRIHHAASHEGLNLWEASRWIDRDDAQLSAEAHRRSGHPFWERSQFDVVLRRPQIAIPDAVETLLTAAADDGLRPTASSRQALRDFRLSASVRLALLARGQHGVEVVSTRGRILARCPTRRSPAGALPRAVHALRLDTRLREVSDVCSSVRGVRSVDSHPMNPSPIHT